MERAILPDRLKLVVFNVLVIGVGRKNDQVLLGEPYISSAITCLGNRPPPRVDAASPQSVCVSIHCKFEGAVQAFFTAS